MRLPRPRLTVRRLMILVAVSGLMMGGASLLLRVKFARDWAAYHQAATVRESIKWTSPEELARRKEIVSHHRERERYWRAAADRPWLPFEADPPEPE